MKPGEREPGKPFRRKRRYQGASWTPPSMSADVEDGLWCRFHKRRHGYKTMGLKYEKRSTGWVILWNCTQTGDVLGETDLSAARKVGEDVAGTERLGEGRPEAPG